MICETFVFYSIVHLHPLFLHLTSKKCSNLILVVFTGSAAMRKMQDAGAASFVLDLRDNPGGLVQVFMSFNP